MTTRPSCCLVSVPLFLLAAAAQAADPPKPAADSPPDKAPAATVIAQATTDTSPASDASDTGGKVAVEKIVVTAQKRAQDIQAVPVSISVLSASDLASEHIVNYEDLSRTIPGVSFNSGYASEGLTNIVIRGISATGGSSSTQSQT